MLSLRTVPVLIGVLLLSGMFLLGQDTWPPPVIPPEITNIDPSSCSPGSRLWIEGHSFGESQGESKITFNGQESERAIFWSDNAIVPTNK